MTPCRGLKGVLNNIGFDITSNSSILEPSYEHQSRIVFGHFHKEPAVAKIFSQERYSEYYREISTLKTFSLAGLPVANKLRATKLLVDNEKCFCLITRRLLGAPVHFIIHKDNVYSIAAQITSLMARQIRVTSKINTHRDNLLSSSIKRLSRKTINSNKIKNLVPSSVFDVLLKESDSISNPRTISLVTHDWRMRHIYFNNGKLCGLLDFEFTRLNDPAVEIAFFLHDLITHKINICNLLSIFMDNFYSHGLIQKDDHEQKKRIRLYMIKHAMNLAFLYLERDLDYQYYSEQTLLYKYYIDKISLDEIINNGNLLPDKNGVTPSV